MNRIASFVAGATLGLVCFHAFAQNARTQTQAPSLCVANEKPVFSCTLQGFSRKIVSLCASPASTQGERRFQYLYGRPSRIELRYPASSNSHEAFTFTRLFYAGGTFGYAQSFRNEGYKYILYSIEGTNTRSGLLVQRDGQLRAAREMVCRPSTLVETKDTELVRITSEWKADADIEAHGLPSTR
ncbi:MULTISPECIES: hypothetical protein [Variovorax]|uniref:hypothetical protein n=1 Tax=Variovorax TaxID=34072 RepID=UPI002863C58D|nr:hypothetical protein [Variovorax sp. 3319]MDR6885995.1 hypothetical protein [Variovorax sp. 3319]